jgi:hypothetical protein
MGRSRKDPPECISEFPELEQKYVHVCRMCKLIEVEPGIIHVLHELFRQGYSGLPLQNKMKPLFEEAGLVQPARQSMMRHLQGHVVVSKISHEWKGGTGEPPPPTTVSPQGNHYETDYIEMRRLYEKLRPIIDYIETQVNKKTLSNQDISSYDIMNITRVWAEGRQLLKSLSDMRNSEKLMGVILVRHTEGLLQLLADNVGIVLRNMRERLLRGDSPDDLIRYIDTLTGLTNGGEGDLLPMFESAAQRAIAASKESYNLH